MFVLLLDHLCKVGSDLDVVVRVADHNETIHFIAGVWPGACRGFLLRANSRAKKPEKNPQAEGLGPPNL